MNNATRIFKIFGQQLCTVGVSSVTQIVFSGGQRDVSKCLAHRHILKSIVKELKEKKQKLCFSKLELTLSVCMQSAALIPLTVHKYTP